MKGIHKLEIKIIVIFGGLLFAGIGVEAGIRLHGSATPPIGVCTGATNDLVFSNNCSGVYYPQILK
jgi:hypothetical protein